MAKPAEPVQVADMAEPTDLLFTRRELEARLRSKRLTTGQRRVAQSIIERGSEIGQMSSTELAELAKVSQPSVTRFTTACGRCTMRDRYG